VLMKKVKPVLFFAVALCLSSAFLFCSNEAFAEEEENWRFDLAPLYLWASSVDGNAVINGKGSSFNLDFNDLFDNLEAALTARFEGWYKNKWGIFFDYNYMNVAGEQETPLPKNIKLDMTLNFFNLEGAYRVLSGTHALDVLAGIRYTFLDMEVTFLRDPVKPVDNESWVDPIAGLRYRWQMFEKWSVVLYGDIGGAVNSDLTWQGLGIVTFQPWKHVSFGLGYRALHWDYESGSGADTFEWKTTMHGPILGANFNW
jgi:hypothetical protein